MNIKNINATWHLKSLPLPYDVWFVVVGQISSNMSYKMTEIRYGVIKTVIYLNHASRLTNCSIRMVLHKLLLVYCVIASSVPGNAHEKNHLLYVILIYLILPENLTDIWKHQHQLIARLIWFLMLFTYIAWLLISFLYLCNIL